MRWGIAGAMVCSLSSATYADTPVCSSETALVQRVADSPIAYCARADGTRHGEYVRWYPDGRAVAERGTYADGVRTGTWVRGEYVWPEPSYGDSYGYGEEGYDDYGGFGECGYGGDSYQAPEQSLSMFPVEAAGSANAAATYAAAGESVTWVAFYADGAKAASWTENKALGGASGEVPILAGPVVSWYSSGSKLVEGQYSAGQRDGDWVRWYENGAKHEQGPYVADQLEGVWTEWADNGNVLATGSYVAGARDGAWSSASWDGKATTTGEYRDGQLVGTWTETVAADPNAFIPNAVKQVAVFGKDSNAKFTAYYADGTKAAEYASIGCPYGELYSCAIEGAFKRWHPNGKLAETGAYEWQVMDCSGYQAKSGTWTTYHDNGKKKAQGAYDWGTEHGTWKYWSEKGKQLASIKYDHGVDAVKKAAEDKERRKVSLSANLEGVESMEAYTAEAILTGDVMSYYGLASVYDTPLKEKHYKKTAEYKANSKALAALKKGLSARKTGRVFSGKYLGEYDLKTKRFELRFGTNAYGDARPPNCFADWCFPKLPLKEVATGNKIGKYEVKDRMLYISATEAEALGMEKRNVDITLIFSPDKMAKQKFLYYANYEWTWYSPSMVSTKGLRVVITAAGSDTILWQRDY